MDKQKQRLITLLGQFRTPIAEDICAKLPNVEKLADYLMKNGVIVLPCQAGEKLLRRGLEYTLDHWNILATAYHENQTSLFTLEDAERALREGGPTHAL